MQELLDFTIDVLATECSFNEKKVREFARTYKVSEIAATYLEFFDKLESNSGNTRLFKAALVIQITEVIDSVSMPDQNDSNFKLLLS